MSPSERQKSDSKVLFAVSALVVGGAVAIAVLAGLDSGTDEESTAAAEARRTRPAPSATRTAPTPAPALPATFEHSVDPGPASEPVDPGRDRSGLSCRPRTRTSSPAGSRPSRRASSIARAPTSGPRPRRGPERAWTHYMLGLSLWKDGRLEEAEVAMSESARLDASSVRTFVNLSRIRNDAESYEAALEAAQSALALAPEDPSALFLEGRSLRNLGQVHEAMLSLERSRDLDPENGYVKNLLGLIYVERSMIDEAVGALTSAAELTPDVAYVHNNLGHGARARRAILPRRWWPTRRAVDCDPEHEAGVANLARIEPLVPHDVPEVLVAEASTEPEVEPTIEGRAQGERRGSRRGGGQLADDPVARPRRGDRAGRARSHRAPAAPVPAVGPGGVSCARARPAPRPVDRPRRPRAARPAPARESLPRSARDRRSPATRTRRA